MTAKHQYQIIQRCYEAVAWAVVTKDGHIVAIRHPERKWADEQAALSNEAGLESDKPFSVIPLYRVSER